MSKFKRGSLVGLLSVCFCARLAVMGFTLITAVDDYRKVANHPWTYYMLLLVLILATDRLGSLFNEELRKTNVTEEA